MRAFLGWTLLIGGLSMALFGLCDASAAWLSQHPIATASSSAETLPPGFEARLAMPRLDASLFVVEEKNPRDLRRGPGFVKESAMPGEPGNCIIAGHRDLHFRVLKNIRVGDEIQIVTARGRFMYRVAATKVVEASDRDALRAVYPQQLTLVTCFPFYYVGPAPKRFIVTAYRHS